MAILSLPSERLAARRYIDGRIAAYQLTRNQSPRSVEGKLAAMLINELLDARIRLLGPDKPEGQTLPRQMKRLKMSCLLWFVALFGCAAQPQQPHRECSDGYGLAWSRNVSQAVELWRVEAKKRFRDPFIFVCHGNTDSDGEWRLYPDQPMRRMSVEAAAQMLHALMPEREIVLIVCNPDGLELHVPHVWYAKNSCWVRPGPNWRFTPFPDYCTGSIYDFREGDPILSMIDTHATTTKPF